MLFTLHLTLHCITCAIGDMLHFDASHKQMKFSCQKEKLDKKWSPGSADVSYRMWECTIGIRENFCCSFVSFSSIFLAEMMLQNQYLGSCGGFIQWTRSVVFQAKENFMHKFRNSNHILIISLATSECQCRNILSYWINSRTIEMFWSRWPIFRSA